ncbi:hypothetical protein TWF173_000312 [Orbilia oligospora]|nr:hypothetical protein TWF173_000312 [Orbilia oligospora]
MKQELTCNEQQMNQRSTDQDDVFEQFQDDEQEETVREDQLRDNSEDELQLMIVRSKSIKRDLEMDEGEEYREQKMQIRSEVKLMRVVHEKM